MMVTQVEKTTSGLPAISPTRGERTRGYAFWISPLEGEMSPKVTEGGGDGAANTVTKENAESFTPLCPAGHLPHKGGDRHAATPGGTR